MEELFARLDAQCPDNTFSFLANAEATCGELTKFALPIAKHFDTLEALQNATPQQLQTAARSIGMPAESVARIIAAQTTPDTRFEGVKTFNGHTVKPFPRWILQIGQIFELLDADKNGVVDLGEYLAMGASPISFMLSDKSGTGLITRAEFLNIHMDDDGPRSQGLTETQIEDACNAMVSYLREKPAMLKTLIDRDGLLTRLFQWFDIDGDGVISWDEMQSYTTNMEMAQMMDMLHGHMDKQGNSDGDVDLDEWIPTFRMLTQNMSDEKFEMWLMNIEHHMEALRAAEAAQARGDHF